MPRSTLAAADHTYCTLQVKSIDLKKFLDNEDVRACCAEFLDTQDTMVLYVLQPSGQPLTARTSPPEDFRKKLVYFLKLAREKVHLSSAFGMGPCLRLDVWPVSM